jgi:hypothetical protein
MDHQGGHEGIRKAVEAIRRLFRREPADPDDPYSLVMAPKKPSPPLRSASAAEKPER